nr:hypothetical protein [Tanacetum cinerariifolium]
RKQWLCQSESEELSDDYDDENDEDNDGDYSSAVSRDSEHASKKKVPIDNIDAISKQRQVWNGLISLPGLGLCRSFEPFKSTFWTPFSTSYNLFQIIPKKSRKNRKARERWEEDDTRINLSVMAQPTNKKSITDF